MSQGGKRGYKRRRPIARRYSEALPSAVDAARKREDIARRDREQCGAPKRLTAEESRELETRRAE